MLIILGLLVTLHTVLTAHVVEKPIYDVDNYESVGHHFETFVKEHSKKYTNREDKLRRFHLFWKNLERINQLNKKHEHATFGISKFSDMTAEEMKSHLGFRMPTDQKSVLDGNCTVLGDPSTKDAPAALDWREKKVVSPVRDQAMCGSCWAFSATAVIESRYWAKGQALDLSEQQMLDCDKLSQGCDGGLMSWGISKVMDQGGQSNENDYPYKAKASSCQFDDKKIAATVKSCSTYSLSGEEPLKELLFKEGPLAIGVRADEWVNYKSGIFEICNDMDMDHGVLLVGYGSEGGKDFWIIKNSWGTSFGENGYIRILRGKRCCQIGSDLSYATVSVQI